MEEVGPANTAGGVPVTITGRNGTGKHGWRCPRHNHWKKWNRQTRLAVSPSQSLEELEQANTAGGVPVSITGRNGTGKHGWRCPRHNHRLHVLYGLLGRKLLSAGGSVSEAVLCLFVCLLFFLMVFIRPAFGTSAFCRRGSLGT